MPPDMGYTIFTKLGKMLIQSGANLNGGEPERIEAKRKKAKAAALQPVLDLKSFVYKPLFVEFHYRTLEPKGA